MVGLDRRIQLSYNITELFGLPVFLFWVWSFWRGVENIWGRSLQGPQCIWAKLTQIVKGGYLCHQQTLFLIIVIIDHCCCNKTSAEKSGSLCSIMARTSSPYDFVEVFKITSFENKSSPSVVVGNEAKVCWNPGEEQQKCCYDKLCLILRLN